MYRLSIYYLFVGRGKRFKNDQEGCCGWWCAVVVCYKLKGMIFNKDSITISLIQVFLFFVRGWLGYSFEFYSSTLNYTACFCKISFKEMTFKSVGNYLVVVCICSLAISDYFKIRQIILEHALHISLQILSSSDTSLSLRNQCSFAVSGRNTLLYSPQYQADGPDVQSKEMLEDKKYYFLAVMFWK